MNTFETLQVVIGFGMLLVTVIAAWIALGQLKEIAKSGGQSARANQNSNFLAVITLEGSIAQARYHYTEALAYLGKLGNSPDPNALDFAKSVIDASVEQYLNTMDRLCACIIRGQVNEDVYRRDYRNWIAEIIKGFAKEFGADTRHHNILAVHKAWQNDKSAVDPTIMTPS